ncbi:MAG: MotA/TolQ/ExbB proton channel family protein [Nitrospinaceae bacterium]
MATAAKEAQGIADIPQDIPQAETGVDMGTVLGVLSGVALIVIAIIRGGDAGVFANLNSTLIVFGGTIATAFIAFPSKTITGMLPIIINAFRPSPLQPADYIDEIMSLAAKYRTGGMKTLENEEASIENRFLKSGIGMVVDGYNGREIHEIMERELNSMVDRHNGGQKILRFMASQAPVFGMAGTLIGLIQMLMHLSDPGTIGPSLATALITTFYGIILANLLLTPIAAKLSTRTETETTLAKAIRVGIIGIHDRLNPAKIQRNMNSLLAPDEQR